MGKQKIKALIEEEYIKLLSDEKKMVDLQSYENFSILENEIMDKYNTLIRVLPREHVELFKEFDEQVDEKKMVDLQSYENFSILENEIMDKYNTLIRVLPREHVELFKEFDEQVSWLRALESNFTFEEGFKIGMKFFNK